MNTNLQTNTRVWWDGNEVSFIGWTDRALIFTWNNTHDTAVQLPRGAVLRLVQKGVLVVRGQAPRWVHEMLTAPAPRPLDDGPVYAEVPVVQPAPAARSEKLTLVSRLIRKLSGGSERGGLLN